MVQSVCLTSRGSGVRLPLLPLKRSRFFRGLFSYRSMLLARRIGSGGKRRLNVKSRLICIFCALEAQSKRSSKEIPGQTGEDGKVRPGRTEKSRSCRYVILNHARLIGKLAIPVNRKPSYFSWRKRMMDNGRAMRAIVALTGR